MSSTVRQQPAAANFYLPRQSSQISQLSTSTAWTSDEESPIEAYSDAFAISPETETADPFSVDIKSELKGDAFSFGDFDDWMKWDEPLVLSPSPEPHSIKQEPVSPNMNNGRRSSNSRMYNPSINPMAISNFSQESIRDEPLFQNNLQRSTTSPMSNLYSTPMAWDRPQPGYSNAMSLAFPPLSAAEEEKLRNIAMNTGAELPPSPLSDSSVEHHEDGRKRKSIDDDDDDDDEDSAAPRPRRSRSAPKRTAHNMIEKRYRTNLNDKIAALRDSVPSLRAVTKKSLEEDGEEDLDGLTPAHKLNKATVLSKATEYIAHLEKRNKSVQKENQVLRSRIEAFEILLMSRSTRPDRVNSLSQSTRY